MILDERIANNERLIMDGAIGTEVARLGGVMDSAAWCGVTNRTHPDVVREVHEAYLRSGADIVTANTFATCRHVLAGAGLADEAPAITARAVELAREAIDNVAPDKPVAVAGSMSNTKAWIPGSLSPDPRYAPSIEEEAANYREMADALASAGADFIIMEMMSDVTYASLAVEAAASTGLPVWIGISCAEQADGSISAWDMHTVEPAERIHDNHQPAELITLDAVIEAMRAFNPQVMGIMHSTVTATEPGLKKLREYWSGPVMAYPEATGEYFIEPPEFAEYCSRWVEEGVQIIGGCCGTTIDHIRALSAALAA